jgi:asparagine synthase (glutamine-hydrolysing)
VSFAERRKGSAADLEAELLHLLRQAVTSADGGRRAARRVPLWRGGQLGVVALMAEASASPVKTCSIGFDVAALDETGYAARSPPVRHRSPQPPGRIGTISSGIDALAAMFDEPFADASALPTWRVCQLARETVTVALSGDGADEAFAGYRRHKCSSTGEDRVRALLPAAFRGPVFGGLGAIYPKADWAPRRCGPRRRCSRSPDRARRAMRGSWRVTAGATRALYSPGFLPCAVITAPRRGKRPDARAPARSGLDRAQYADLKFWLPGDILTKVDRTSMAVSLEAREPLLDHRLIEFAASLPETLRLRRGRASGC